MIDLTGKSVFVGTQEEYLSVLKMAKLQGFTWARGNHLNPIEIPFPNILNFYSSKDVTYRDDEKTLYEASEIVEDEEKIKDAVNLVRTFAKFPDRAALTDTFIESLKLLANTVESQLEEVKQMERLTERVNDRLIMMKQDSGDNVPYYWDEGNFKVAKKLADYEDAEEQGLLVRLPCKVGDDVYIIPSPSVYGLNIINGYENLNRVYHQHIGSITFADSHWYATSREEYKVYNEKVLNDIAFGITWFTDREEAEKKLEEMKND